MLENYRGILIFTSSWVRAFDETLWPRIQVKINYPPLDVEARKQVWKNSFGALKTDKVAHNLPGLVGHLDELADEELNGREICNILTTASRVALFKGEMLDWGHLHDVITAEQEINKYVGRSTSSSEQ